MKIIYTLFIFLIFQHCSFDNKSGIWKNEESPSEKTEKNKLFNEFKTLSISENIFNKEIQIENNFVFKISEPIQNFEWNDVYYKHDNNYENFKYKGINQKIQKSKKLTRNFSNNLILFDEKSVLLSDESGNIITYDLSNNIMSSKYNFYKKKYKKFKKNLNFIVNNNIIYIADNIGYLYAYNYKFNNVIWAKNYKIPFRSNLKILKGKLIASNQNNTLYFFDKTNGELLKKIPTEETIIKNHFINNLSSNGQNTIFFLNSYGTLYSFNIDTMKVNWFVNLNQNLELNPSNLFFGNQIVFNNNKIIVSSNKKTYIIDFLTGSILYKKNFSSYIKPIINNDYAFFITSNNFLISMNLDDGKIIYSYDINKKISDFLNLKPKNVNIKNFSLADNKIIIFLKNSYVLAFEVFGEVVSVKKLPSKIKSDPIFINETILFMNKKNQLVAVN
jgi:hypothetical protein